MYFLRSIRTPNRKAISWIEWRSVLFSTRLWEHLQPYEDVTTRRCESEPWPGQTSNCGLPTRGCATVLRPLLRHGPGRGAPNASLRFPQHGSAAFCCHLPHRLVHGDWACDSYSCTFKFSLRLLFCRTLLHALVPKVIQICRLQQELRQK